MNEKPTNKKNERKKTGNRQQMTALDKIMQLVKKNRIYDNQSWWYVKGIASRGW